MKYMKKIEKEKRGLLRCRVMKYSRGMSNYPLYLNSSYKMFHQITIACTLLVGCSSALTDHIL